MTASTGTIKSIYVCCGLATPISLKKATVAVDQGFALGIEVAVLTLGKAATAERTVEFRAKGKAIDANMDTPIIAHALGDTKMRVRPVDGIQELSSILGQKAIGALRVLLLRSELYRVIVKDVELVEGRHMLSLLNKFPGELSRCGAPRGPKRAQGAPNAPGGSQTRPAGPKRAQGVPNAP